MMRRILAFFLAFVLAFGMVPVQVFAQENTNETIVEENGSSAEDVAAAQAVTDQIAGLGEVTLESGSQIAQIRAAYEALTQEQKDLVSGLDALKAAEESLAEQKTQADKQAAQTVTEQIAAIGTVTEDSQNAISAARAAYDELTDIQKGYVENLSILEAAETAFAELQQQESQSQAPVVTSEKSEEEATATSLDTSDLTFDVEKPDGYVTVSFVDNGIRPENANILNAELYGTAVGTIIAATEVPYVEGDSVADVTVRLLKAMNLEYSSTGTADDGFYLSSLNGFELNGTYYATFGEFDAGSQSGWCVRVNNWHINQGSSAVEVEDGDVISWLYTCQYGADIGADFSTRSAEITGVVLADSTLNLAYDAETDQYTCVVPAETTAIAFEVFLENYASIVTMTVDGNTVKYRPNQDIRVTPNSTIVIRSELEYMDADNNNEVTTYTDSVTIQLQEEAPNSAPTVSEYAPSSLDAIAGEKVSVTLSGLFTDADGDTLTYHIQCKALGIDQDVNGSVFTGTIPNAGTYTFVVTASDGEASVSHTVTLNVTEPVTNSAPAVTEGAPATMEAFVGEKITVDLSTIFSDPDGDELTFKVTIASLNLDQTLEGSLFTGTIPAAGAYEVILTANDGTVSTKHTVMLTVTEKTNSAPTIKEAYAETKSNTYIYSSSYVYIYMDDIFEDADGDTLTYKATLDGKEVKIDYNDWTKQYAIQFATKPAVWEYQIVANDGQADSEVFTAKCIGTSATITAPEGSPLIPGGNYYYYVKGSAENDTFALNYTLDVEETIATEWTSSNASVLTSNGDGTFTVGDVTSRQQPYVGVTAGKDDWGSVLYLGIKYFYILPAMPTIADITAPLAAHADDQKATVVSNAVAGGWYTNEFDYMMEDPSICDLTTSGSYGLSITPKALGTTKVTATFKYDKSIQCTFHVTVTGRSLQIQGQSDSDDVIFEEGKTVQLEVLGAEEGETFTWSSSDESVATVEANGLVTVKKLGQTYITAVSSLSTEEAPVQASMYLQVKESGKVYLDDIAVTDYSYFDGFISAKSGFNSAQLTYDWDLQENRYTYNKLAFTPYFDDETLDAVLHYQVSGGEYQTMDLTDGEAVSIANGLNPGENVVKIDVYPTDSKDNVTTYTFNIFRPYNPSNTISRMTIYPNGEASLAYPTYKDNKEGTIFQWDTAANDFVAGWNGKPSTGWSSTKDTFKTFIFGSRTSTISVYPTFAYAGQRVMIYVDGEEFEEAVTNWKSKTIPVDADGTTITFHVNSEKYHAAQVAAGVEDPFAEPEKKYTLLVESVEPLGIDSKILSAELEGGEFYKPGFSSDSYTISALIPAGQTTVNLTFTVPAGIDVYKTSVTDANKLATEQTDEDGNLVYTTPIVTITGTGMYAYSTTNIILQVTDEEGNIGKTQYAFTVSQRGTKDVYPDRVVDYLAIGSQYTNASSYGTMPERTLKSGGGTLSLGNFGGYIIYQYDIPIQNSPNNPYGVDFVVYGNSFGNGAHEPGYVQVSKDGETWYTLAGSEHYEDHNDWGYVMTYTNNDGKSAWTNSDGESGEIYNYPVASAYPYYDWTEAKEQSITVFGPRLNSEAKDAYGSAAAVLPVFGYVDVNTNGTINGTSNNPYNHPGTLVAGGDQFDLAWAVDETGMPVSLDSVSYIRIATASSIYAGAIGEKSTEVTAVNRVTNGAEAAVGVTASPSAITVNGKTVAAPADGGILTVTVAEETLDVAVTAVEGTNIYIGNVGSAQRSYTALPGKGIIRIIAQEGQKEPYICYLKLREPCTGTDVDVTWGNFGNNETNNRITAAATPKSIDYTHLNWVKTYGGKPSLQIIVDNALVFMSGNTLYKVSLADGSVLDSTTMDGSSAYTYIAPTYANGMIFCALNGGKVQAFDAATLDSLWIYTDELGGQDQVPITYSDDCVYTGFWSGETKDASYVCIDVASGEKVWSLKHTGGFYWAGAVVIGDAILFGSDDGANGTKGNGTVYTVNKKTGEVISTLSLTGLGDQRSTIVYDNGRVYFTTKGGYVCSAAVASDGSLSDLKNVKASGVFASTCTPVVYGDYIYYGASSKYFVIADKDTLETKHTVTMQGYSQHSSLLSTAYAVTDGYLYFYTTYNAKPGGISLIKVDADAADFTAEGACQLIELYDARGYEEYCISGIITDASGNLYYKNDSGCIFSIGKTVTAVPQFTQNLTSDEVKYNYQIDEAAQALTVAATVADEGLLTYQWQRSADGANWTDIADATAASYVPPITELGTVYYRCVAVNTLNGVSEKAVSEAAMIVVKTFNSDTSLAYVVTNSNSKPSVSFATVVNTPAVINTSGNNKPRVWLTGPADGTVAVEQVVGTDKITVADSSGYKRVYFSAGVTAPNHLKVTVTAENGTQKVYYLIVTADGVYTPASGTVTVTIANAGQLVMMQQEVTVSDQNGDGRLNVDEALYAAHEIGYTGGAAAGYGSADTTYGRSITKLWGDTSGAYGYWLNHASCWSLDDEVAAEDYLAAFVYQDATTWSDAYSKFDSDSYTAVDSLTVKLEKAGYDENWNTVFAAHSGAKLTAYDSSMQKLAENDYTVKDNGDGTYDVAFAADGIYYLVASDSDPILVPAVCQVEFNKLEEIEPFYKATGEYLAGLSTPTVGSINGEWRVIGLLRSGREVDEAYYNAVVSYVQSSINENEQLNSYKSTENSRLILALTAMGKDVTDVGGHNLLEGLTSMDYVTYQGINGAIFALLAFDSHDYTIPKGDVTREALVDAILDAQLADGGWTLSGTASDSDMTGMALQALAPYYGKNTAVTTAVDKALAWLSDVQLADGAFAGADGVSAESLAQIITGLTALGINPEEDTRFIKNGISAVDALAEFYVEGGGFRHILRGNLDMMATEQSYYALASYFRLLKGKTSLYDMTDVKLDKQAAAEVEELIAAIGTPVSKDSKEKIEQARTAYTALTKAQKALVDNYDDLTAAEKAYADLVKTAEDEAAANAVEELINAIGTPVTLSSEKTIADARAAYDKLDATQKALVDNYKTLTDAEAALKRLKDEAEANKVEALINAIGNNITLNSESAITKARTAYNSLTADQKKLVENYQSLVNAETKLKELKSTIYVSFTLLGCYKHGAGETSVHTLAGGNLSTWIPTTTYKVAPGATVKDVLEKALTAAGMSWSNPTGNYVESINGLGEFSNGKYSGWMYTLNGSHPNLGVAQQTLVSGDSIVFHYTDDYTKEESSQGYKNYSDEEAAKAVEKLIDDIGDEITLDSEAKIVAAREAYGKLTETQKKLVGNYEKLVEAEKTLAELKNAVCEDCYKLTGDYLEDLGVPEVGTVGGEWMVIGLARSGREVPEEYYDNVVAYVQENIDSKERLHANKSTENSRLILALTTIGKDVTDVDGHNLLAGLSDMDYICKQGINGPIWALIAFNSGNYPIPEGNVTREMLIETILDAQLEDGGWALSGSKADPDMTGMAVQALAPYCKTYPAVKKAVDESVWAMAEMQNENGAYSSVDGASSESIAQIIVALSALGIDADTDARFVKNGISAFDALLNYYVEGGGFRHILGGKLDGMATEQAYYAMTAYYRMLNGKTSLYDMTDIIDLGGNVVAEESTEATEITETAELPAESTDESSNSVIWISVMTIALAAAAAVVLGRKKLFKF